MRLPTDQLPVADADSSIALLRVQLVDHAGSTAAFVLADALPLVKTIPVPWQYAVNVARASHAQQGGQPIRGVQQAAVGGQVS